MELGNVIDLHAALRQRGQLKSNKTFLCFGTDWDGHPSSMTHLFKIIAQEYPVIWVNSIGQRGPKLRLKDGKRVWQKLVRGLKGRSQASAAAGFARPKQIIEPRVLPYHQFANVRRFNTRMLEQQIAPALAQHLRPNSDLIFAACNPAAAELAGRFGARLSVYYCMDEYAAMADSDPAIIDTCEPLMLAGVDMTFATSAHLCATKRHPKYDTMHLPQGVDFDHFQKVGPCPPELKTLPRPIIGFQGIVGERVDLRLLDKVARRFPRCSIVLLGRREADISGLKRFPNVHYFEPVPYAVLPRWLAQFDIGLIAYKDDGHTQAVNPLKLLEYLAVGAAVVSTELPELARHKAFVHTAADHEGYIEALGRLVARYPFSQEERARRMQYAQGESWRKRAEKFLATCDSLLARRHLGPHPDTTVAGP